MGSSPPWVSAWRRRPYGPSCAATASTPRRVDRVRRGRSSCERRRRRCWPATSSPSTRCSCAGSTCCSSSRSTRGRVYVTGVTASPVGEWVTQQARNLTFLLAERSRAVEFLIRDRDTKFTASFDEVFRSEAVRIIKTPIRTPRANAFAERFVGTVRRECLDRILIIGRRHLEQVLVEYLAHYNQHRPHRSLNQRSPQHTGMKLTPVAGAEPTHLRRNDVLGGLIHEYRLVA